jgi:protein SCO1
MNLNAIKKIAAYALFIWAFGCFLSLTGCSESKIKFRGVDITGADYAKNFALTDHNGQPKTIADFKGKVTVVFFGFAQCPDVCPTTMAELAEVKKVLGKDGDKLQAVFITIDPERDNAQVLKAYMANFDPSFLALYGTPEKIADTAKEFRIFYNKVEGKTAGSYTMEHTAGSYVFDTQGRIRVFSRYGSGAQALVEDIQALIKQAP